MLDAEPAIALGGIGEAEPDDGVVVVAKIADAGPLPRLEVRRRAAQCQARREPRCLIRGGHDHRLEHQLADLLAVGLGRPRPHQDLLRRDLVRGVERPGNHVVAERALAQQLRDAAHVDDAEQVDAPGHAPFAAPQNAGLDRADRTLLRLRGFVDAGEPAPQRGADRLAVAVGQRRQVDLVSEQRFAVAHRRELQLGGNPYRSIDALGNRLLQRLDLRIAQPGVHQLLEIRLWIAADGVNQHLEHVAIADRGADADRRGRVDRDLGTRALVVREAHAVGRGLRDADLERAGCPPLCADVDARRRR